MKFGLIYNKDTKIIECMIVPQGKENTQFKKGNIPHNKGTNITNSGSFKSGHKLNDESIEKMRDKLKGRKSWNTGTKGIMKANKTSFKKGQTVGELNNHWKGGITPLMRQIRSCLEYKQWRSNIFFRDNWTCQTCGSRGCSLEVHHIKAFSLIIKENNIKTLEDALNCEELWDINNGVTLCEECHKLTDNYLGKSKQIYG
jgi:hypothetical protein